MKISLVSYKNFKQGGDNAQQLHSWEADAVNQLAQLSFVMKHMFQNNFSGPNCHRSTSAWRGCSVTVDVYVRGATIATLSASVSYPSTVPGAGRIW